MCTPTHVCLHTNNHIHMHHTPIHTTRSVAQKGLRTKDNFPCKQNNNKSILLNVPEVNTCQFLLPYATVKINWCCGTILLYTRNMYYSHSIMKDDWPKARWRDQIEDTGRKNVREREGQNQSQEETQKSKLNMPC